MSSIPLQKVGVDGPTVSRIALGCMGISSGATPENLTQDKIDTAIRAFKAALEAGITVFDHADIYGRTASEIVFKSCLQAVPGVREKITIATKCGIRHGFYELDADYILRSIEGSLTRMGLDYIDIYQMHRPDPFAHPRETAKGLKAVVERGLARHVGVSNYFPEQIRALEAYLDGLPIVSNQISISLTRLEPIYEGELPWLGSGVLDFAMARGITPLAYSPLGRGWLSGTRDIPADNHQKEVLHSVLAELRAQAKEKNATPTQVALAWLLAHPAGIIPLVGSNDAAHIAEAAGASDVAMSRQDWYKLWTAARGKPVM